MVTPPFSPATILRHPLNMPPLVADCYETLNIVGLLTIYVPLLLYLSKMNSRLCHMYQLHFGMVSFLYGGVVQGWEGSCYESIGVKVEEVKISTFKCRNTHAYLWRS